MSKQSIRIVSIVLIVAMLSFLCSCGRMYNTCTKTVTAFDTVITVTLYKQEKKDYEGIISEIIEIINEYELILSAYNESSELFLLNQSGGGKVSDKLFKAIASALDYCEMTDGVFDITLGAVNMLWNVTERTVPPTEAEIKEKLKTVGYTSITAKENLITYGKRGTVIDLGGFSKGYMCDIIKEYLSGKGIESGAIIAFGGNVCCIGGKPLKSKQGTEYKPYSVGMQAADGISVLDEPIKAEDTCVISSGRNERYFKYDGKVYHHIIDPITGYPAENPMVMCTVVTPIGALGDVLSTTAYILGEEKIKAVLDKNNWIASVRFLSENDEISYVN